MKPSLVDLYPDEFESLLEALRRDLRSEISKSQSDVAWADWHEQNVRKGIRILEAINPKRLVLHQLRESNGINKNDAPNVLRAVA